VIASTSTATVKSISIGGSLIGGSEDGISGRIDIALSATLSNLFIGGDLRSTFFSSGEVRAGTLSNVTIGGSVYASETPDTEVTQIFAAGSVGTLRISGSVGGNDENMAVINFDRATKVKVNGRVDHATIIGEGAAATVGKVNVGGAWVASRLAVGTTPGADTLYGTADDTILVGTSSIGSVKIKGQALGSPEAGDSFRIISKTIGAVSVGGVAYPFGAGAQSHPIGVTDDFVVIDQT